jgi:hypothetical protein
MARQLDEIEDYVTQLEEVLRSPAAKLPFKAEIRPSYSKENIEGGLKGLEKPNSGKIQVNCLRQRIVDKQRKAGSTPRSRMSLAAKTGACQKLNLTDKTQGLRSQETGGALTSPRTELTSSKPRVVSKSALKERRLNDGKEGKPLRHSVGPKPNVAVSEVSSPRVRMKTDDSVSSNSSKPRSTSKGSDPPFSRMLMSPTFTPQACFRTLYDKRPQSNCPSKSDPFPSNPETTQRQIRSKLQIPDDPRNQRASRGKETSSGFLLKVYSERLLKPRSSTSHEPLKEMTRKDYNIALKTLHDKLHDDWL